MFNYLTEFQFVVDYVLAADAAKGYNMIQDPDYLASSKAPGSWGYSAHGAKRATERFLLTEDEKLEVLANLEKGYVVRVPENNPRDNAYLLQTAIAKGTLFISVGLQSKTVITLIPATWRFPGELPGDPIPAIDSEAYYKEIASSPIKKVTIVKFQSPTGLKFDTEEEARNDLIQDQLIQFWHRRKTDTPTDLAIAVVEGEKELKVILRGDIVYPYDLN